MKERAATRRTRRSCKILKLVLTRCDDELNGSASSADTKLGKESQIQMKRSQILIDRWKDERNEREEDSQDIPAACPLQETGVHEVSSLITEQRATHCVEQVSPDGSNSALEQEESALGAMMTVSESGDQSLSNNFTEMKESSNCREVSKKTTGGRAVTLSDTSRSLLRGRAFLTTTCPASPKCEQPDENQETATNTTDSWTQGTSRSCFAPRQQTEAPRQLAVSRRHDSRKRDVFWSQTPRTVRRNKRVFMCDFCPAVFQHPYNIQYHRLSVHHSFSS